MKRGDSQNRQVAHSYPTLSLLHGRSGLLALERVNRGSVCKHDMNMVFFEHTASAKFGASTSAERLDFMARNTISDAKDKVVYATPGEGRGSLVSSDERRPRRGQRGRAGPGVKQRNVEEARLGGCQNGGEIVLISEV